MSPSRCSARLLLLWPSRSALVARLPSSAASCEGLPSCSGRAHGAASWRSSFRGAHSSSAAGSSEGWGSAERKVGPTGANSPASSSRGFAASTQPAPAAASAKAAAARPPTASSPSPSSPSSPSPASASPSPPSASSASAAPWYAGLAGRYPDADAVPEALLQRLRDDLFGRAVGATERTGRRALARPLQGRQLADWYFVPPAEVPGFHNEEYEYEQSKKLNQRHRAGAEAAEEAAEAVGGKGAKKKK